MKGILLLGQWFSNSAAQFHQPCTSLSVMLNSMAALLLGSFAYCTILRLNQASYEKHFHFLPKCTYYQSAGLTDSL